MSYAPCAANDTQAARRSPPRHTRPQSQLCNLRCATSPLPHHCLVPSMLPAASSHHETPKSEHAGLQSGVGDIHLSAGHRTIETRWPSRSHHGCRTWTRAIDPPACDNDIENSICQASAASSSVLARWRAAVCSTRPASPPSLWDC
jgi:hypothetical protein